MKIITHSDLILSYFYFKIKKKRTFQIITNIYQIFIMRIAFSIIIIKKKKQCVHYAATHQTESKLTIQKGKNN